MFPQAAYGPAGNASRDVHPHLDRHVAHVAMSGLFEALTSATSALSAHRLGLDVTGHNMANINTAGYSRRVLQLAEVSSADPRNAGRGVEVIGIRAMRDEFLEARVRRETGAGAFNGAVIESARHRRGRGRAGRLVARRSASPSSSMRSPALADDVDVAVGA